jgi:hypothetical protein
MHDGEGAVRAATERTRGESVAGRHLRFWRLLRKAVLGDWHPLLRDPLDLLRLSFAVAAVGFLLAGSLEYAVRLAGTFLLLMLAQRLRMPRLFDLLFIIGMMLQAWGNALRLFENVDWWDNLVHLSVPFSSVPALYVLSLRLGLLPDISEATQPRHRLGLVLFAMMSGLSIGALYEIYEYVAVHWLDAGLAIGYSDTIFDLTLDAAGSFAGGLLLMLWATARWGTERSPGM